MKTLFTIAVVSFAALVWAALAIMRHVRRNSTRSAPLPVSDAEMSEALDVRLAEMARRQSEQRASALGTHQDFSYFHRDAASSVSDKRHFVEPPPAITPATAERP